MSKKHIITIVGILLILISFLILNTSSINNSEQFGIKNEFKALETHIPPTNRVVVNIPDQNLKNGLLKLFKLSDENRSTNVGLNNLYDLKGEETKILYLSKNYIKPENENEIYEDEMLLITKLNLNSIMIGNITGLDKAINITKLNLVNNNITDLSNLSGLKKLISLNLASNSNLSNIDAIRNLSNLNNLYLDGTIISNLEPISKLINLEDLYLGYNDELKNLEPLRNLINLKRLGFEHNHNISNIDPIRNLTNLETFYAYSLNISNIEPLSNLEKLSSLDLGSNYISDLSLFNKLNLKYKNYDSQSIYINPEINEFEINLIDYNGRKVEIENSKLIKKENGTYSLKNPNERIYFSHDVFHIAINPPKKIEYTKEIAITGGNKDVLPKEIDVVITNDKNLPEKTVKATLKTDKSGYEIAEKLDRTTDTNAVITYNIRLDEDIINYKKQSLNYIYDIPKISLEYKLKLEDILKEEMPNIELQLLQNGNPIGEVVKLDENLTYKFNDLDETNFEGVKYNYSIKVIGDLNGYEIINVNDTESILKKKNLKTFIKDLTTQILPYTGAKSNITFTIILIFSIILSIGTFVKTRKSFVIKNINIRGLRKK